MNWRCAFEDSECSRSSRYSSHKRSPAGVNQPAEVIYFWTAAVTRSGRDIGTTLHSTMHHSSQPPPQVSQVASTFEGHLEAPSTHTHVRRTAPLPCCWFTASLLARSRDCLRQGARCGSVLKTQLKIVSATLIYSLYIY